MSGAKAWHFPLQELPRLLAWLMLFIVPAMGGAFAISGAVVVFQFVLPYVLVLGAVSSALEVQRSKRVRVGGVGDVGLAVFRNISHTGFMVVAGLIVGVLAMTILHSARAAH